MGSENECLPLKGGESLKEGGTKGEKDSRSSATSLRTRSSGGFVRLSDRLTRNQLLRGTRGTKKVFPVMVLFFQENPLGTPRYAIYAPSRIRRAVVRNRVKRIFREVLNRLRLRLRGYDVIIIPRREIQKGEEVFPGIEKALMESGLLTPE